MQIKEIEVRLGRTLNMGDFESFRADVGMKTELGVNDDPDEVYNNLKDRVEEKLLEITE